MITIEIQQLLGNNSCVVVHNDNQEDGKQNSIEIFMGDKKMAKSIANRLAEVIGARIENTPHNSI